MAKWPEEALLCWRVCLWLGGAGAPGLACSDYLKAFLFKVPSRNSFSKPPPLGRSLIRFESDRDAR